MYGLTYQATQLYYITEYYEFLYDSPFYESNIGRNYGNGCIRFLIYNTLSNFYKGDNFVYEEGFSYIRNLFKPYKKSKEDGTFFYFGNDLEKFQHRFKSILLFFDKKDKVEENNLKKRDVNYINLLKNNNNNYLKKEIRFIINHLRYFGDVFYTRIFILISEFAEQYVKILLDKDSNKEKVKELLKEVGVKIKETYEIWINIYALCSSQSEMYFDKLIKFKIFKELSYESIIDLFTKYKKQIEEWNICVGTEKIYFGKISKSFADGIEYSLKYWKYLQEKEKGIGVFFHSYLVNSDEEKNERKTKDKDNDLVFAAKSNDFNIESHSRKRILFYVILIILIVSILLVVKLKRKCNNKNETI